MTSDIFTVSARPVMTNGAQITPGSFDSVRGSMLSRSTRIALSPLPMPTSSATFEPPLIQYVRKSSPEKTVASGEFFSALLVQLSARATQRLPYAYGKR